MICYMHKPGEVIGVYEEKWYLYKNNVRGTALLSVEFYESWNKSASLNVNASKK